MSGLEVAASVAAIISVFVGVASFLQERKKRKAGIAPMKWKEIDRLKLAVISAPRQIRQEYEYDLARIGGRFASGDAITRNQLTWVLLDMQQSMIQTLQGLLWSMAPGTLVDYSSLLHISDRSRLSTISALAQQYQRFRTTSPIFSGTIVPTLTPQWCPGAFRLQTDDKISVKTPIWKCSECSVTFGRDPNESHPPLWARACRGMHRVFMYKQHVIVDRFASRVVYSQCAICWDKLGVVSGLLTAREWFEHVNQHLSTGGFEMCKDRNGQQQRQNKCADLSCAKLHAGVQ